MDQSYFQNAPNLFRTLYKSGMDNILDRTGQKFGISVTGIMGVNCSSYMEIYERNNSFTTILTLTMFRILNMVDKKGKEILKNIVVNPTLDREHIKKELSKNIKSKSEKLIKIGWINFWHKLLEKYYKTNLQHYTKNYTTKNFNYPKNNN